MFRLLSIFPDRQLSVRPLAVPAKRYLSSNENAIKPKSNHGFLRTVRTPFSIPLDIRCSNFVLLSGAAFVCVTLYPYPAGGFARRQRMAQGTTHSPKVTHLSWGRLEAEGEDRPFKDAKLFPGGARDWDWNETGTRHEPGVQPADAEELLDRGSTVVILSKGFHERLRVPQETLRALEDRGITVHVGETEEAVRLYNELRETEKVGALIHSTC